MAFSSNVSRHSYRNNDGLNVWYGPSEGIAGNSGEVAGTWEQNHVIETVVHLPNLASTAAFLDEHVSLPRGAFIEQVEIVVLTGATGSTATLNFGLEKDDDSTNVSDTALVSALAVTSLATAGDKIVLNVGSTGAGSSIGGTTPTDLVTQVTGKYGTAAFTAGDVLLRILWNTAGQLTAIDSGTTSST
jgi:hypothetical protein